MRKRKCGSQKYLIWWGKETVCGSMHTSYLNGRHLRICWVYTIFLIELSIMLFTEVEQIISWRKNKKKDLELCCWYWTICTWGMLYQQKCHSTNIYLNIYFIPGNNASTTWKKNQWKRLMKISNVGEAVFHLGKF